MPTEAEYSRHTAQIDRELMSRQASRLGRFQSRSDLSQAARELARSERVELEARIAALDAQLMPRWPHGVLQSPAAAKRLRQAMGELASLRAEFLSDRHRSSLAAGHRRQQLEETAAIQELAELNRVPDEELRAACPSIYAERSAWRAE